MDILILLTVLQMVSLIGAYEFICPSQAHWNLRAKSLCKATTNYTCLFDINLQINVYRDRCNRPRILGPGYKYVFQPNLNRAACNGNRYQPFIFETVGYSDCTYQKSLCNSQGQETYEHGDTRVDRKCICNTERGYNFVRNSNNKCYCNPSSEDCSCYLGINPFNTTIELKDIKCYAEKQITRSPYLGDLFNNSRTITINEFHNYKYNLNNVPTNEHRIEAAISVLTLILSYFAVCIVVDRIITQWTRIRNNIQMHPRSRLDLTNMNEPIAAIKDGKEIRRYIRIQVIGKEGVGKSSLVRRLVGDSNMIVNSTDGIDIVKKCQIRTTDGEWVIGEVETEREKIITRIQQAVLKEQTQGGSVPHEIIPDERDFNGKEAISSVKPLSEVENKQDNQPQTKDEINIASSDSISHHKNKTNDVDTIASASIDNSLIGKNQANMGDTATLVAEKSKIDKPYNNKGVLYKDDEQSEDSANIDEMRKKIMEEMKSIIVQVKKDQDKMTSESLVECGLWDFAGQKDYYATHQTFLNPHAIYLLVTNISEDIAAIKHETDFDSIEEYIDFWFDSIHCLSTSSLTKKTNIPKGYPKHRLYPPVIVVCTHIDEYNTVEEFVKRKKEYIERFEEIFGGQNKANHNRGIHFISNTSFLEGDCKKLKDTIYEVAKETMFFEEELPTQWIQLENALSVLKHESKLNILSFQNIVELSQITFIEEEQLLPFLTYQHKIGNIIFFEDIKEYIILQPEWLVKCFRCLVCDDHELKRNHSILNSTDWQHLKNTGKLSDDIIDRLFEKEPELDFGKYKTHILNVMEKFDIIVKPQFTATNNDSRLIQNSYYMPCMITTKSTSLDTIQKSYGSEKSSFSSSPWLILEFKFFPLAYFNHILFYYITKYTVCEEKEGRKTLYREKALVNIDKTELRKLCICFSKNVIALQIWQLADVENSRYDTILEELCRKIEELKRNLSQNISYDIKVKCRNGDYSNTQGRITYKELEEMCEQGRYYCREHNERHSTDNVEKTWLQHADIVMAKLNTEQAENNPRNSIEITPTTGEVSVQKSLKNNLPVSANLRRMLKISKKHFWNKDPDIYSCIKIGNTLVFTDWDNKQLIICNSDGTDKHHMSLSYKPFYITEIDSNTVAVSCRYDSTILIINISTRSITSTLKTSGRCYGISYNDNNLYVVIDSIIHVMDLTGKVIRTIPLPADFIFDITVDRDRLVCINYTTSSIYCCSLDGKVIWKFEKNEFQDLTRVTTDNEGNVYMTDESTHTVIVVSDDGKHHRELLTESDGLDKPSGIYFDKKENVLLVYNETDAFLFDVIKKLT